MFQGFLSNRRVRIGLAILLAFVLVAILGDQINALLGHGPFEVDYNHLRTGPFVGGHPLGTNSSGQDVLAQTISGARGSIIVGLVSAIIATVLAGLVGITGGFMGGYVDQGLNAFTNLFLTLPSFALTLIVAGYISSQGGAQTAAIGLASMAVLIGVFEWPGGARYLRSQTLSLRSRDFAVASRMLGEPTWRLLVSEVLPHLSGILSAMFLRATVAGIFAEAGLNFLGVSTQGAISWGTMISNAQAAGALTYGMWWWFAAPGLCIALVGTATALVNFGLDEVSNPRLRTANRSVVRRFEAHQKRLRARATSAAAHRKAETA
ncbi:ABC transporter permease [Streptomyces sp. NPDC005151]